MLKSSNLDSIIASVEATTTTAPNHRLDSLSFNGASAAFISTISNNSTPSNGTVQSANTMDSNDTDTVMEQEITSSLASVQLTKGLLQIYEPPLLKARGQLKELIGKQNKIYIDLSAEKYKLDNAEIANLHEMMNNIKIYREKLIRIKKQMQNIYQRTKTLKKRAVNIQTCKQKELQRKLQKQQQEESLIGKQQQQEQQQQTT